MDHFKLYVSGYPEDVPNVYVEDETLVKKTYRGEPLGATWVPSSLRVTCVNRRLRDLLCSLGATVMVVSRKFVDCFSQSSDGLCEFIPLTRIRHHPYFIWHVTKRVDCLDLDRSDVDGITRQKFVFDRGRLTDDWCFKVPQSPVDVIVNLEFVRVARDNGLTGIGLQRPDDEDIVRPESPVAGFPT